MTHRRERTAHLLLWTVATCFGAAIFAWSAWRWWTFRYTTFDLAFYVQGLWQALHGRWEVTLLDVPLLGNHAEPIVFLALPLFALWPHPMLLVLLQTLALASMPFTAFRIARRLGLELRPSMAMAIAVVLCPATGFIGLHEFHPEALAAPLLLLIAEARLASQTRRFWLWWLLALATKENIALLLIGWAAVQAICDRRASWKEQIRWNLLPGFIAATWLTLYASWLAPRLNGGKVDYLELYSHFGRTGPEITRTFLHEPARVLAHLRLSLCAGDLVWATLLPFAALPLLRPRWMLMALPLLLQHLLSWRTAEWTIRFHYAAPFVALFWIGSAEALARRGARVAGGWVVLVLCAAAQAWWGPLREVGDELSTIHLHAWEQRWKAPMLAQMQADGGASVMAGSPYLSHLATRERLYSLHHLLKGLQTLSRRRYVPPPHTDYVVLDCADQSTFSRGAGFYHPQMRTAGGELVPSSEALLHQFLKASAWSTVSTNSLSILRREGASEPKTEPTSPGGAATLDGASLLSTRGSVLRLRTSWSFATPREEFRWMKVLASSDSDSFEVLRGLVGPESTAARYEDVWTVLPPPGTPPGRYRLRLYVDDQLRASWNPAAAAEPLGLVNQIVSPGVFQLEPSDRP